MDEYDLPEPIIQVVQSFLTSEEAARTTILSKSWLSAWLTRPNLDFDIEDFRRSDYKLILSFVERTLERYENSNLNIHSFKLSIKNRSYAAVNGTLTKLVRVLKLGPTRLTFELADHYASHLPNEVFRYESLISLTAKGCEINPNRDEVCCSRLQFLSFDRIRLRSRNTILHILSSCPLIEKLSLDNVDVDVGGENGILMTIISPLHRLKSLVLKHVNFDTTLFLADLSSKLPSLKDLTLHINRNREEILISSPTLERLDFNIGEYYTLGYTVKVLKLDVPSIRKLTFACSNLPDEVFVTSNSRGWESCVSVNRVKCLSASWFYKLSNFIDKFKFSRISRLSLHVYITGLLHHEVADNRGLPTPEIGNLTIHVHEFMTTKNCCALFDELFQMCHPKVINIPSVSTYGTDIILFLAKQLLDVRDAKVQTPNQYYLMHSLNEYLKESRAQVFDAAVSMWRDVTLESLVIEESDNDTRSIDQESYCGSSTVDKFPVIRFQLNWKQ